MTAYSKVPISIYFRPDNQVTNLAPSSMGIRPGKAWKMTLTMVRPNIISNIRNIRIDASARGFSRGAFENQPFSDLMFTHPVHIVYVTSWVGIASYLAFTSKNHYSLRH